MLFLLGLLLGFILGKFSFSWLESSWEDDLEDYYTDQLIQLYTSGVDSGHTSKPEPQKLRLVQGYGGKPMEVQKTSADFGRGNLDSSDTP